MNWLIYVFKCLYRHWCVGKKGSFGFAKGWLVCREKPNVPLVGWLKEILKNAGGLAFSFFSVNCPNSITRSACLSVRLFICPLGRYGLYVESIFSHCLALSSFFLALVVTCYLRNKDTTFVNTKFRTFVNHLLLF